MREKYKTTKAECKKRIHGVCPGCGGKLEPIETVDNSGDPTFWVGCKHCSCFRSGVDRMYFEIARELIEQGDLIPYSFDRRTDAIDDEYWLRTQTAGLSHEIVRIHNMINSKMKGE